MHRKLSPVIGLLSLILTSGCTSKQSIPYDMHHDSGKKYLFTRKQQIIFLGFIGKKAKHYESESYSRLLSQWLAKRPLFRDISGSIQDRDKHPSIQQLQAIGSKHSIKRILLFRTVPRLQAVLYTFGKEKKHSKVFRLTSCPILQEPDDLLLTLAALDVLIQPTTKILSADHEGSLIVLPRTAPDMKLTQFLILPTQYMIQNDPVAMATVFGKLSSTVLKIRDRDEKITLRKGLWAFPIVITPEIQKTVAKNRQKLEKFSMVLLPGIFTSSNPNNRKNHLADIHDPTKALNRIYGGSGNEDR